MSTSSSLSKLFTSILTGISLFCNVHFYIDGPFVHFSIGRFSFLFKMFTFIQVELSLLMKCSHLYEWLFRFF